MGFWESVIGKPHSCICKQDGCAQFFTADHKMHCLSNLVCLASTELHKAFVKMPACRLHLKLLKMDSLETCTYLLGRPAVMGKLPVKTHQNQSLVKKGAAVAKITFPILFVPS